LKNRKEAQDSERSSPGRPSPSDRIDSHEVRWRAEDRFPVLHAEWKATWVILHPSPAPSPGAETIGVHQPIYRHPQGGPPRVPSVQKHAPAQSNRMSRGSSELLDEARRREHVRSLRQDQRGRGVPQDVGRKVRLWFRFVISCTEGTENGGKRRSEKSRVSLFEYERKNGRGERILTSDPLVPDGFESMFRVPGHPENSSTLQSGQRCLT